MMLAKISSHVSPLTLLLILTGAGFGQGKTEIVTLSDPAPISLKSLFAQADVVAFVRIQSGDAESYKQAIYKAEVLNAYKGAKEKEVVYFGPFISYGIGTEYLVFLKKTDSSVGELIGDDKKNGPPPYDASQSYYRIMYDGYSIMPVGYECLFDGKGSDRCDYSVRFNTYQVLLPAALKTFPKDVGEFSPDVKWVRRKAAESALMTLANGRK